MLLKSIKIFPVGTRAALLFHYKQKSIENRFKSQELNPALPGLNLIQRLPLLNRLRCCLSDCVILLIVQVLKAINHNLKWGFSKLFNICLFNRPVGSRGSRLGSVLSVLNLSSLYSPLILAPYSVLQEFFLCIE